MGRIIKSEEYKGVNITFKKLKGTIRTVRVSYGNEIFYADTKEIGLKWAKNYIDSEKERYS